KGELLKPVIVELASGGKVQGNLEERDGKYFLTGNPYLGENYEVSKDKIQKIIQVRRIKIDLKNGVTLVGNIAEETTTQYTIEKIVQPKGPFKIEKNEVFDLQQGF